MPSRNWGVLAARSPGKFSTAPTLAARSDLFVESLDGLDGPSLLFIVTGYGSINSPHKETIGKCSFYGELSRIIFVTTRSGTKLAP